MNDWIDSFVEAWTPNDCFDYIDNQQSFSREKKLRYIDGCVRMLTDTKYNNFVGKFRPMVKSGEVYEHTAEQEESVDGYNNKTSDRPRCIMPPTPSGIGPMQSFQASLFGPLKRVLPEFIHSATSADIVNNVTARIQPDFRAISVDGSAFDASQFAEL